MREVDLFGTDLRAISPIVSSMRLINCHYIVDPSLEKGRVLVSFHGSEKFAYLGSEKIRSIYTTSNGEGVYVITGNKVYKLSKGGVFNFIGNIETTDTFIQMADSGQELIIVDSSGGYIVDITKPVEQQTLVKITDPDFPPEPTGVIFNTGRFLVTSVTNARFYGSDIYDGLSWDGLNFASAETYPDNIVAIVNGNFGTFYLMGTATTEIWYNTGGADFPYALMSGGVLNYGCTLSPDSIIRLGEEIIFLGNSQAEGKAFYSISGQQVRNITNPEMYEVLRNIRFPDFHKAVGYSDNGIPIFQVTFKETGKTYFYDARIGMWGERISRGLKGHVYELGTYSYGQQFFTSSEDGTVFKLNPLITKDGDYFQDLEFIGRHTSIGEERFVVDAIQFKMEVGQGKINDYNQAPIAVLSYSKDGGWTWTPEIFGSMGKIGDYLIRLIWRRLGTCRDIVFKLKITDRVERRIISAFMLIR